MKKILIVGAGLSGCVIARELAEAGNSVSVIDRRHHVAGNAYDYVNDVGIRIHKYGPHLFHTSNMKVVDWLSRFTEWVEYKHKVKALLHDGRLVTLPVNQETQEIVGRENVLDIFFRPYTKKMWGMTLDELDPSVISRIPVRDDLNEYYFPTDTFQGLPADGYERLALNILAHENIQTELGVVFSKEMEAGYDHVFNSMAIDEYFDFKHGKLPYRSIKFHHHTLPIPQIYSVGTVNFTHSEKFTRVTEWKNLPNHGVNPAFTSVTCEEPCDYEENDFERYYPVKDTKGVNLAIYKRYKSESHSKMTFIGRCGLYAYLDMHQAVSSALAIANEFLDR